jgi:hypothetical protein
VRADGTALVHSSYLGGNDVEFPGAAAVDPATGDAIVVGATLSRTFPTTDAAFDPTCGTDGRCNEFFDFTCMCFRPRTDAFVTRIGSPAAAYFYIYPDSGQVQAGVPFDLYVFALDAGFNIITDYTGLILFWSTDPKATTPEYYRFQPNDQGIAYFPGGVTLRTSGPQELYVFDWPAVEAFGYAPYDVTS